MMSKRINFKPEILTEFFDYKVREYCKSCKRYGKKAQCPPFIEKVDYYKNLLPKFDEGILFIERFDLKDYSQANWVELGEFSSKKIQGLLISERIQLLKEGILGIIFGAGSCKNCRECSIPCRFPESSLIPLEGAGINVVRLVKRVAKVKIEFPVKDYFYRVGMILYDKKI